MSLVAILDADKEGFLRSERSLIQTIGRRPGNVNGKRHPMPTGSPTRCGAPSTRPSAAAPGKSPTTRRTGITPRIRKQVRDLIDGVYSDKAGRSGALRADPCVQVEALSEKFPGCASSSWRRTDAEHARNLEFEQAARCATSSPSCASRLGRWPLMRILMVCTGQHLPLADGRGGDGHRPAAPVCRSHRAGSGEPGAGSTPMPADPRSIAHAARRGYARLRSRPVTRLDFDRFDLDRSDGPQPCDPRRAGARHPQAGPAADVVVRISGFSEEVPSYYGGARGISNMFDLRNLCATVWKNRTALEGSADPGCRQADRGLRGKSPGKRARVQTLAALAQPTAAYQPELWSTKPCDRQRRAGLRSPP